MKSIMKLDFDKVVPVEKIEKITGKSLERIEYINHEIQSIHPGALQQSLEFSMTILWVKKLIPCLPIRLEKLRGTSEFADPAINFLKSNMKSPAIDQRLFILRDSNGFNVCELHLADLIDNQWMISDIVLRSEEFASEDNSLLALHKGLGNGIFDIILQNLIAEAASSKVKNICLMAFTRSHQKIFEKRGYENLRWKYLEENADRAMSFPMKIKLS